MKPEWALTIMLIVAIPAIKEKIAKEAAEEALCSPSGLFAKRLFLLVSPDGIEPSTY
jgi:hypothetical protein